MNAESALNFFGAFLSVLFLIILIEIYYDLYKVISNKNNFSNKF
jgi:uncharacterized membrane protein (DUF373 family)